MAGGRRAIGTGLESICTDHQPAWRCRGSFHSSLYFKPRIAQSHVRVTHMVQDSSLSPANVTSEGGSGCAARAQPGTPPPAAATYRPRSARFAEGPPCLRQLGSHRPRDHKQAPGTGPCARPGAAVSATPAMPRRPGGKTRLSLSFLESPGCRDTPQA